MFILSKDVTIGMTRFSLGMLIALTTMFAVNSLIVFDYHVMVSYVDILVAVGSFLGACYWYTLDGSEFFEKLTDFEILAGILLSIYRCARFYAMGNVAETNVFHDKMVTQHQHHHKLHSFEFVWTTRNPYLVISINNE
jgi:hypothetical protein